LPNSVFWWGRWICWHSVLILMDMCWLLPFSCFCCLSVGLCAAESMLLSDSLSFLFLWFDTAHPQFCLLWSSVCRIP
jgi:hypothetical protein